MFIKEREQIPKQQCPMTSIPSTSSMSSDFLGKTSSRRSIDWRDSGIVIDDDYQLNFASFESIGEGGFNRFSQLQEQRNCTTSVQQIVPHQFSQYDPEHDDDGDSILHLGVVGYTKERVRDLIRVCNVNAINNMMQTPLHVAILANRAEMVDLLVKQPETKLDSLDRRGNTPFHLACQMGLKDVVEIILDSMNCNNEPPSSSKFKMLIETTNFDGQTGLHLAALNDRRDVIELLVRKYDADLTSRDSKSGETILHKAIEKFNLGLVESILDLSAQKSDQWHINKRDYSGRSPLDKARIMLESQSHDHKQIAVLFQISRLISDRVRFCSESGCRECSSSKSEKILKLLAQAENRMLNDEEAGSPPRSVSSSDCSNSDDYEMC